jgi:hypothetical protein
MHGAIAEIVLIIDDGLLKVAGDDSLCKVKLSGGQSSNIGAVDDASKSASSSRSDTGVLNLVCDLSDLGVSAIVYGD